MSPPGSQPSTPATGYDVHDVEARWRARWRADDPTPFDVATATPATAFYNLVEFPYPSADGLHVGHAYAYAGADALGRYMAMRGREVLQPMGWDAFGIHAENYALKVGEHPRHLIAKTIDNYRRQLERLGADWTWELELATHEPSYYRWTQWIFVKLFETGLAEQRTAAVTWCPSCRTVLAFEQLEEGVCERCGSTPGYRRLKQWFLRITAFADELVDGLDELDWTEDAKRRQRDWIGRSRGVEVVFPLANVPGARVEVFTTRLDTIFGATFVVVSPDHEILEAVREIAGPERAAAIDRFRDELFGAAVSLDRFSTAGRLSHRGVDTGLVATHPFTGADLPVFVADYVVAGYGTGAVMGVPAHDERDHELARQLGLPIVAVVSPGPGDDGGRGGAAPPLPFTGRGVLVDSGEYTGLTSDEAIAAMTAGLVAEGTGRKVTRYRLHDWLVSRQRYWGTPIPIVHCPACGPVAVPVEDLPVELPDIDDVRPTGTEASPLAAVPEFVHTACPRCGGPGRRETDVLDTFVESSWYFLRYPSVGYDAGPWDPEVTARLLPVDMYAGGPEHATRHHLYARFVTRALHSLGHLPFAEPFTRLRLHGLLIKDGAKMSKSRGNVVNPDDYVDAVGGDVLRAYLLFCGPWEEGGDFTDRGLQGIVRWNQRLWRLLTGGDRPAPPGDDGREGGHPVDLREIDRYVARVERSIESMKFNTGIAALMEFSNWLRRDRARFSAEEWDRALRTLILLLAPFQPHLAEEMWSRVGGAYSVHGQPWPTFDPAALVPDVVTIPVSVDGKVRGRVEVAPDAAEAAVVEAARRLPGVVASLSGRETVRIVYVPGRLINLVTR